MALVEAAEPLTGGDGIPFEQNIKNATTEIRKGFIRKVYGIVGAQLLLTALVAYPVASMGHQEATRNNGWIQVVCFILCLGNILALICCLETTRKYPLNYAILFGLTLGNGGLVGLACQLYTAPSIILAVSLTAVTLLSLTLYAAFGGKDLTDITDMSIYLFTGLMVLCFSMFFLSIMQLIGFDLPWVQKLIAVCGTVLFSFYIVFDTQMIMGGYGGHKMEFSLDDYVFAALNLYLDIINLFMYILQIVGSRD